jgi:hypothetical protein
MCLEEEMASGSDGVSGFLTSSLFVLKTRMVEAEPKARMLGHRQSKPPKVPEHHDGWTTTSHDGGIHKVYFSPAKTGQTSTIKVRFLIRSTISAPNKAITRQPQ